MHRRNWVGPMVCVLILYRITVSLWGILVYVITKQAYYCKNLQWTYGPLSYQFKSSAHTSFFLFGRATSIHAIRKLHCSLSSFMTVYALQFYFKNSLQSLATQIWYGTKCIENLTLIYTDFTRCVFVNGVCFTSVFDVY